MLGLAYIAAVFGLLIYAWICTRRPGWGLAAIFVAAPFQHDIGFWGVRFSAAEVLLLVHAGSLVLARRCVRPGPVFLPALIYLSVCVFSWIMSGHEAAATSVLQMAIYLLLAVYVGAWAPLNEDDVRQAFHALIAVGILLGGMALATRSMYFLGMHKNSLGNAFSSAFLASFILWDQGSRSRVRTFHLIGMLITLAGVLIVASRGAWLGTIGALMLLFVFQGRFAYAVRLAAFSLVFIPLLWFLVPAETRTFAMDWSSQAHNFSARLDSIAYARELFERSMLFGSGVGLRKEYDATNLVMIVLAETGLVGLAAFTLLILSVFLSFRKSFRVASNRLGNESALVAVCLALFATRFLHGMVDHYWGRGLLVLGWTSVGLAWAVGRLTLTRLLREKYCENEEEPEPVVAGRFLEA